MLFEQLIEVLDPEPHNAALNMAIDEALLVAAQAPTLRIYRWAQPAVSFGCFGKWAELARAWPDREIVRRWTGGGIVPHGADVTYTLIVPRACAFFALGPLESYRAIHAMIATVLGDASLAVVTGPKISDSCFENAAQHDVVVAGQKAAGAAQRRTRFGLLHQGSIQPVNEPERVSSALPGALSAQLNPLPLSEEIFAVATHLALEKYGRDEWTRRF